MKKTKYAWGRLFVPALLAANLLGGCAPGSDAGGSDDQKSALKIMYYDERSFFDQYGMLFSALHPEVEIEVITTQSVRWEEGKDMNAAMLDFIEEQKPDVVMLSADQYKKMAEEGKLIDLDARVEEKSFDKEGIMPGMLDYLREMGGGKLYGLVPEFYSQAIYYNKELFTKYNIDLPQDKMSWDDLFRLAAMFPTTGSEEDRVYGLKMGYSGSDLFQLGTMIGSTLNLNVVDPAGTQVTINSDAWKRVFGMADNAIDSGTLYQEDMNRGGGSMSYEDYLLQDPFIGGKVAMTMDGTYIMDQIKQAQETVKDKAIQNWDIVTMPVDPANPESSPYVSLNSVFAISAQSGSVDAAWEFMSYVHSDEFARVTSKRQRGNMSVRTKYLKDDEGHNFAAFYSLKPMQPAMYSSYDKLPESFLNQFMGMAQGMLSGQQDGKEKPIEDLLDELQAQAQDALTLAIQQKNSGASASPSASSAEGSVGSQASAGTSDSASASASAAP